jgi:hypothetical protein
MLKFLKMLIGIGLLPACWAISTAVYHLHQASVDFSIASEWEAWALPIGFVCWVLIYFILPRPLRTYVLGHELTHALWALMMGARVGKMKIGKNGGHVELSKTNFIITLSPYFFPFYTFLAIAAYSLAGRFTEVAPFRLWWLGLVGLTWAFHVTFTMHMLSQQQPDIQEHGRLFSYAVIYIMNILSIGIWMVLTGSPKFIDLGTHIQSEITSTYTIAWYWIISIQEWIAGHAANLK